MEKMNEIVINLGSYLLEKVKSRVCEGDFYRPNIYTGIIMNRPEIAGDSIL